MFPSTQKKSVNTDPQDSAEITFCGGVSSVTGANFLLNIKIKDKHKKVLIDCGMEQGSDKAKIYNASPFIFDPKEVEILLVTHAHMDQAGNGMALGEYSLRIRHHQAWLLTAYAN